MSTINIALTSYPKRINNCVRVINSVLDNTVKPDRIYLTLSHKEFPDWEQSLPNDLYRLIMTSNKVILNWVEANTKSMKKVFPILPYLEDDDIIIDIDDDMLLPNDFIESRVKDFDDNGREHPITSNQSKTINMDNYVMSCCSLFQKKMLNGYEKFLTKEILETCNDDRTYLYLCHLNGYSLVPCTKYCIGKVNPNHVVALPTAPHGNYKYVIGPTYDKVAAPLVAELSCGKSIYECFGLFNPERAEPKKQAKQVRNYVNVRELSSDAHERPDIDPATAKLFQYNLKKPIKHDVVYVLGNGSKYSNLEIKISITSMLKYCSHWINEIYVVGENSGIKNPKVHHIYAPDVSRSNKDANIIYKLNVAMQKIPKLTENFLFCSDDILVTRKSDWEDFMPRMVFEYNQNDEFRRRLREDTKNNPWDVLLLGTLDRFVGNREHIYFYEPHIFAPINKKYFKRMCSEIDYLNSKYVIIMSLWFNWLGLRNPPRKFDHLAAFTQAQTDVKKLERHLTYNDKAFGVKKFRDMLIELVTMEQFK